jgi:hypothetical protein
MPFHRAQKSLDCPHNGSACIKNITNRAVKIIDASIACNFVLRCKFGRREVPLPAALIKKKIKFSCYIRKFEWSSWKVIYEEGLPNI